MAEVGLARDALVDRVEGLVDVDPLGLGDIGLDRGAVEETGVLDVRVSEGRIVGHRHIDDVGADRGSGVVAMVRRGNLAVDDRSLCLFEHEVFGTFRQPGSRLGIETSKGTLEFLASSGDAVFRGGLGGAQHVDSALRLLHVGPDLRPNDLFGLLPDELRLGSGFLEEARDLTPGVGEFGHGLLAFTGDGGLLLGDHRFAIGQRRPTFVDRLLTQRGSFGLGVREGGGCLGTGGIELTSGEFTHLVCIGERMLTDFGGFGLGGGEGLVGTGTDRCGIGVGRGANLDRVVLGRTPELFGSSGGLGSGLGCVLIGARAQFDTGSSGLGASLGSFGVCLVTDLFGCFLCIPQQAGDSFTQRTETIGIGLGSVDTARKRIGNRHRRRFGFDNRLWQL